MCNICRVVVIEQIKLGYVSLMLQQQYDMYIEDLLVSTSNVRF